MEDNPQHAGGQLTSTYPALTNGSSTIELEEDPLEGIFDTLWVVINPHDVRALTHAIPDKLLDVHHANERAILGWVKDRHVVVVRPAHGDGRLEAGDVADRLRPDAATVRLWTVPELGRSNVPDLDTIDERYAAYDAKGLLVLLREERPWAQPLTRDMPSSNGNGTHSAGSIESDKDDFGDPIGSVDPAAFHGVFGRLALGTLGKTEANTLFILAHLLGMFGIAVGRGPYFPRGTGLRMNLQIIVLGPSGMARKMTSAGVAQAHMLKADPLFVKKHIVNGLSSARGLLERLRDASSQIVNGKRVDDDGVTDKRLLCIEEEIGSVLMQGHRETEPLLCYIRQFSDSKESIHSLTKNPVTVTRGHVGIAGHGTLTDMRRLVTDEDKRNGTVNRFIPLWGVRDRRLSKGDDAYEVIENCFGDDHGLLARAIGFGSKAGKMRFASPSVEERWDRLYKKLEDVPAGPIASLFARAPSNVLRIASNYALSDQTLDVGHVHLDASEAIWQHSERTLRYVFQSDVNEDAERLKAALRKAPSGLTKTQIFNEVFGKNAAKKTVETLLKDLLAEKTILSKKGPSTGGRQPVIFSWNEW